MTRRLVIAIAVVALAALAGAIWRFNASGGGAGAPLSGKTRAEFVRSATESCLARQKASPDNAEVEPAVIESFCGCYADALASRVSAADLDRLIGATATDMQSAMRAQMSESEAACLSRLDEPEKR